MANFRKRKEDIIYRYALLLYDNEKEQKILNEIEKQVDETGLSVRNIIINALYKGLIETKED